MIFSKAVPCCERQDASSLPFWQRSGPRGAAVAASCAAALLCFAAHDFPWAESGPFLQRPGPERADAEHISARRRLQAALTDADLDSLLTLEGASAEVAKVLEQLPTTSCKLNTFFIDWGSSGMKMVPVHAAGGSEVKAMKVVKATGLDPQVPAADLTGILDGLALKLPPGHSPGAVIATAGFRLQPEAAASTWQTVRKWNAEKQLFAACDDKQDLGCRTLPGSTEAKYETLAVAESPEAPAAGSRWGMASCGGASIQVGFRGVPQDLLSKCVADLEPLDEKFDPDRAEIGPSKKNGYFSWLANFEAGEIHVTSPTDYDAGGLDAMRARYDQWLHATSAQGAATNPCVSSAADAHYAQAEVCNRHTEPDAACLSDSWGSFITSVPGRPEATRGECRESVSTFLSNDAMLAAWHASEACRSLSQGTAEWRFVTSFGREAQLGVDVSQGVTWGEILKQATDEADSKEFESAQDLQAQLPGKVLTSALLIGFLQQLGLDPAAHVQGAHAETAVVAMEQWGLQKGWYESCPAEPQEPTTSVDKPTTPGCWVLLLGGCPNHPEAFTTSWQHDFYGEQHEGAGKDETVCKARGAATQSFCGAAVAPQTLFIPEGSEQGLPSGSVTTAAAPLSSSKFELPPSQVDEAAGGSTAGTAAAPATGRSGLPLEGIIGLAVVALLCGAIVYIWRDPGLREHVLGQPPAGPPVE
eukprot:TRINITY_DN32721_c0_g1_i1.p1 TRINITY_DN32721_c0_g1~~TRINITY_DN32721_c0_g1_i1.p1  ORF type:complete len:701 (-),score=172.45 TRINITY_DN32721_c0_g1_i1:82-2184(-)